MFMMPLFTPQDACSACENRAANLVPFMNKVIGQGQEFFCPIEMCASKCKGLGGAGECTACKLLVTYLKKDIPQAISAANAECDKITKLALKALCKKGVQMVADKVQNADPQTICADVKLC